MSVAILFNELPYMSWWSGGWSASWGNGWGRAWDSAGSSWARSGAWYAREEVAEEESAEARRDWLQGSAGGEVLGVRKRVDKRGWVWTTKIRAMRLGPGEARGKRTGAVAPTNRLLDIVKVFRDDPHMDEQFMFLP